MLAYEEFCKNCDKCYTNIWYCNLANLDCVEVDICPKKANDEWEKVLLRIREIKTGNMYYYYQGIAYHEIFDIKKFPYKNNSLKIADALAEELKRNPSSYLMLSSDEAYNTIMTKAYNAVMKKYGADMF